MRRITLLEALYRARRSIGDTDSRMLLQYALNVSHAHLIAHPDQELLPEQIQHLEQLTQRRAGGEPVAYLTGEREFYSLGFRVTPAVLIPRPETELLVDLALERIPAGRPVKVLDLGTGSGVIALTIAKHRPLTSVVAVDFSSEAVEIARSNAERLDVHNVSIMKGDWFDGLAAERFDLIVSNPPYVANADPHLSRGDLRFEPVMALTDGGDGLGCLRSIIGSAPAHLAEGGALLVEHGYDQAETCRLLLEEAGFGEIICRPDLAGIPRISGGIRMTRQGTNTA
ncbi:MAG: peptide chain release factor N(5)-glutamine methyltransferase [Betaproteobacteria bacterium]|nr:peptide chain release factor N(5)-glutamine methyltransferase [Betaproteobacteria bacterium]